jgi:hypothetical protein
MNGVFTQSDARDNKLPIACHFEPFGQAQDQLREKSFLLSRNSVTSNWTTTRHRGGAQQILSPWSANQPEILNKRLLRW